MIPLVRSVPDKRGKKERDNITALDLKRSAPPVAFPYILGNAEVNCSVSPIEKPTSSGDAAQIEDWALTGAGIVADWPRG